MMHARGGVFRRARKHGAESKLLQRPEAALASPCLFRSRYVRALLLRPAAG
jgi:hypothetical protein